MNGNSLSPYVPHQVVSDNMDPKTLLSRYLRHWPWFVLSVGLAIAGAYVYLARQQPLYLIESRLLVAEEKKESEASDILSQVEGFVPKKVIDNEIQLLRSYTLMERVAKKLNLNVRYYHSTRWGNREVEVPVNLSVEAATPALYVKPLAFTFRSNETVTIDNLTYPLNQSVQTPYGRLRVALRAPLADSLRTLSVKVATTSSVVKGYLENLRVEPTTKNATVVQLKLEDALPNRGRAVLDELMAEYNQATLQVKNQTAASTLRFIEQRLGLLSGEVSRVEKDVENYKSNQGITDLGTQAQTLLQTGQANDAMLNQVNVQLASLESLQSYLNRPLENRGNAPATLGLNDPMLLSLLEKLTQLELQHTELARTSSGQNPMLQSLDSQINTTRNNITENIRSLKSMLLNSRQQYETQNKALADQIRAIPQQERALLSITRQQSIKNDLYTYLLRKREETAVAYAATLADSRVFDVAQSSDKPVKPIPLNIYVIFGFLGLLVPIAFISGRDALSHRVSQRRDVEAATAVPILGEVVRQRKGGALVIGNQAPSIAAEQIRSLRANLPFLRNTENNSQVLLITSSISGEGKSFVTLNLGTSLALAGHPTIIIDMDLRKPKLHEVFSVDNGVGLSTYLRGEAILEEVLQPVPGHDNYFIIPSGPRPANPSELLSGSRLRELLHTLRSRFAYVLIDTPPIGLVSDAQLVAPFADTTLFVVRHQLTPKDALKDLDSLYRDQRLPQPHIVLNAIDSRQSYHYRSSYAKGYAYHPAN